MRSRMQLIKLVPALAVALALAAPGQALAQSGDSSAAAINTTDGSSVFKLAFDIRRVMNGVVDQQNAALAYASCESCEAVAISFQIVLVMSDPSVVSPENLAVAINESCSLCTTYAGAFQFVFGNGGRVRFTGAGQKELSEIRNELRALEGADLTGAELSSRVDALATRVRTVIATEVVPVAEDRRDDEQRPATGGGAGADGDEDAPATTTTSPTATFGAPATSPTETAPTTTPPTTTTTPSTSTTTPEPTTSTSP